MTEHLDMTVFSAYLDSELDGHERARATRHLHDCPACSATLAELRTISQGLQQLACAPPPVEPSAQLNPWFARQPARPRWLSHPLSAAAPIMLGLLIGNALPRAEHNLLAVLGSAPPGALCARPEFCYLKVNLK